MNQYDNWRDVDLVYFKSKWKNFSPYELRCRGTGSLVILDHALDSLQLLRELINKPLIITSAYRSPIHNARVGGSPLSRHKVGDAFDISLVNNNKEEIYELAKKCGFTGFGLTYNSFIHIDKGRSRKW